MSSESALKSFLSGGFGGLCAVVVGHPFDLIKVRIQTGGTANASTFGMLRQTLVTDGIRGIYRGVSAPIVAVTPMFAISFWGYDMGKRIVDLTSSTSQQQKLSMTQLCIAGGISAIPSTVIMAPSERLKCLLQVEANEAEKLGKNYKPKYTGLLDCAKQVYKQGGIRSIYKGTGATLLRDIPGSIAWYGTYEWVKKELMIWQDIEPGSSLSPMAILCAGGIAGVNCWAISIPADTLKSRFQTAPPGQYNGIYDVYKTLMKEEGPTALFRGMRPAMIRAFPANAACFFGMELSREALSFLD